MNKEHIPSIGIVGVGFVGTAIYNGFKYCTDVKAYDIAKNLDSYEDTINQDILFMCLPTPEGVGGGCYTYILEEALKDLFKYDDYTDPTKKIVIIKSTVPPGFCARIQEDLPNLTILHSPEFLTERMATLDFATQTRVIIGADGGMLALGGLCQVEDIFYAAFPKIDIVWTTWAVSSLVKYGLNAFFATKVTFFNELAKICEAHKVNYSEVLGLMNKDGRMTPHHTKVPGHDGRRGFGGLCLPKDLNALIQLAWCLGVDVPVMKAVRQKNNEIRGTNV